MTFYAAIDTNVLVSALISNHSDAATVQVVEKIISGEIIPIYSQTMMWEYRNVMKRKKFNFSPVFINVILSAIENYGILVQPTPTGIVLPDIKDLPFYEVTVEKRDIGACLVTGNIKHFPKDDFIVTARQMIDILKDI
ncbi:MAG TPA: putative toxin-antitoxin system toxin component, PIN family [Lachnospiraceae bacterium]|nr:putative toxin-antitoxin system toxin component, PIN family [Lachnospiraceae bacterium]